MKIEFQGTQIQAPDGLIDVGSPILDARRVADTIVILCDWMAFPEGGARRNLFGYDLAGGMLWQAQDIGMGELDAYTSIISEDPLIAFNYACFACTIDPKSGEVTSKRFMK